MVLERRSWPIRAIRRVWHVGSMREADKAIRGASQEGTGLSVSRHPREWTRIAKLEGKCYRLESPKGRFLDYHKLSSPQRERLMAWAVASGLLRLEKTFDVKYVDDESEEARFLRFTDEARAREELEMFQDVSDTAKICASTALCAASALEHRMRFKVDPLLAQSLAITCWVEDCTQLSGVWWTDTLEVTRLSAPRGVIVPSRLKDWDISEDLLKA